jgi:predicted GNAT family N-acyltransferase
MRGGGENSMHNDTTCTKYSESVLPDENGNCSLCGAKIDNHMLSLAQKKIEDFLTEMGFTPTDEYEEHGVLFTKYEAVGIAIRIERTL